MYDTPPRRGVSLYTTQPHPTHHNKKTPGLALWDRMQELGLRPTMATVDVALKLCEKVLGGLAYQASSIPAGGGTGTGSDGSYTGSGAGAGSKGAVAVAPVMMSKAKREKREHALERATTILEQSLEWGLVGRRATFRRVLRLVEGEKGRGGMVQYADGLFKSGHFRCVVLGAAWDVMGRARGRRCVFWRSKYIHPSIGAAGGEPTHPPAHHPPPQNPPKNRRLGEEGRLLMVEALCDVGLFRHALHILRAAAPAHVPERYVRACVRACLLGCGLSLFVGGLVIFFGGGGLSVC